MKQKSLSISKIYYYLIAFISLFVVLFNVQAVASTVLRFYVFKTPPAFQWQPPFPPFTDDRYRYYPTDPGLKMQTEAAVPAIEKLKDSGEVTEDQKQQLSLWLQDVKTWRQQQEDYKVQITDQLIQQLVTVLIFTPVFVFHFYNARKSK